MRHYASVACCGLWVLALACACNEGKEGSVLSTGQVKQAATESAAEAVPGDKAEALATPGTASSTDPTQAAQGAKPAPTAENNQPSATCAIHSLALEDVSSDRVLDQAEVHAMLAQRLETRFGSVGSAQDGLTVKVEYLVYRRDSEGDSLYLGARALISKPVKEVEVRWEASASAEAATPGECKENLASPACSAFILRTLMPGALDQLVLRTHAACSLETAPVDEVRRVLGSPDAWERAQAAKASGERGLKELANDLTERLKDKDELVVVSAIAALGRLEAASAVDALVARAQGAASPIVAAVAVALLDIGTSRSRSYVEEWAKNHPLPEIRERCSQLLSSRVREP